MIEKTTTYSRSANQNPGTAQPDKAPFSDGSGTEPVRIAPPFGDQRFDSFDQWVAYASSWLTCHIDYNNTEHGDDKGWRGNHFTALCFDSLGRRCRIGSDMHRARDEGAFPVWWVWPDQIVELVSRKALSPRSARHG